MPFYLINVETDDDANASLVYSQSDTLVREMTHAKASGTHVEGSTTYTFNVADIAVDLDPTFLPSTIPSGWTELDGYTYRGLKVAMLKAAEPVYYLCDISTDTNGGNLVTYTNSSPAVLDLFYAQEAVTYSGVTPNITLADGDFIVGFHPDHVPTIPGSGWTRLDAATARGIRLMSVKTHG